VKKSALLVAALILMLSGMLDCFCATNDSIGILSDLTLLDQLENKQLMENIEYYSSELEYQYNDGVRIIGLMEGYGKLPNTKPQQIKTHELLYALGYKGRYIEDTSLIFRDGIFMDYYEMRTAKVLEEYKKSGMLDFSAFIGRGQQEFDIFLKEIQKDDRKRNRVILLLQDKLTDKMFSDDVDNKSGYYGNVLALRSQSNSDKRNQSIYELMESRVRLKLLQELVDINRESIEAYLDKLKVTINNDTSGVFSFRYISDIEERTVLEDSIYMTTANPKDKLVLSLGRLATVYGKATFTDKKADVKIMSRDSIWNKISVGAEGGLEVSLGETYINESEMPGYDILSIIPDNKRTVDIDELSKRGKILENSSEETQKLAQEITKDLCALSIYRDLKSKGIYNSYTAKFEADEGAWLKKLNKNLNAMNKLVVGTGDAGVIGFLRYIRQYVDYSRDCTDAGFAESRAVLAFRDTVLQFRQVEAGALWITDMLYQIKYLN
jgi:tRNA splicing endonuclease